MTQKILRLLLYYCMLLQIANCCSGQNWLPLDKGIGKTWAEIRQVFPDSNVLYVTGTFTEDGNNIPMRGMAKWNGIKWDSVGDANKFNATKADIYKFNDTLLTSSVFYDFPHISLSKLKGEIWEPYPNTRDLIVDCFLEKNGILYMGGTFDKCGNDSTFGLGKFDGINFSGLTPCYDPLSSQIFSLAFFQDTLYVGGIFDLYPLLPIGGLAKWDGINLLPVSPEFLNSACAVYSMVVYNEELYIGGSFQKSAGFTGNNIMKWDGHNFSEVGGGTNGIVSSMQAYNNELYIGGFFTEVGGVACKNIAKWNGSQWTCLNNDVFDYYQCVRDICIFKDELYVAGHFRKIGNDSIGAIAKYNHPLTSVQENHDELTTTIYPNPFTDYTTLQLTKPLHNTTLTVFDILGNEVKRIENLSGKEIKISRNGMSRGMYFFRIVDGTTNVGQGKMVVE